MLRVTVEILPGGREAGAKTLAVAHIWRKSLTKKGASYGIRLGAEAPDIDHNKQAYDKDNRTGELKNYPRWSASIWDLVARSLQRTLRTNPKQQSMGAFPQSIADVVPVFKSEGMSYVRFQDMPDFVRPHFEKFMDHKTAPLVEEEADPRGCAFVWDWHSFLGV